MTIEERAREVVATLDEEVLAEMMGPEEVLQAVVLLEAAFREVEREALEKVRDIVLLELIPGANLGIAVAEESEGPSQAGRWIDALQVSFRERIRDLMPPAEGKS